MDATLEQIIEILTILFSEGRITIRDNQLFVDNTLVADSDAEEEVDPTPLPTGYDQYGISNAVGPYGAVRLKVIDERIEEDLKSSDPLVVKIATLFPQNFFMNIDRNQTDREVWNRNANYNKYSFLGGMFSSMRLMPASQFAIGKWVHKETGELLEYQGSLTNEQRWSKEWKKVDRWDQGIGKLENHWTYSRGIFSLPTHPKYVSGYLEPMAGLAIKRYEKQLYAIRKQAERERSGAIAPRVGPFIR